MRRVRAGCAAILLVALAAQVPTLPRVTETGVSKLMPKPALVVLVILDQFRPEYLKQSSFGGGIGLALRTGAVFTNAHVSSARTETSPVHAGFLSGASPSRTGIVSNEWWDRESGRLVTSVEDDNTVTLGCELPGASPRRLQAPGLVEALRNVQKLAGGPAPKAIGIGIKDRSAILPVGRQADGAYWFDRESGSVCSSSYYVAILPEWAHRLNVWNALVPAMIRKKYRQWSDPVSAVDRAIAETEVLVTIAVNALHGERLGRRQTTDILTVSVSAVDELGHRYGPASHEVKRTAEGVDRVLGRLFLAIESLVGLDRTLVIITSDHGVAPLPPATGGRTAGGGRTTAREVRAVVEQALRERYGSERFVLAVNGGSIYLDRRRVLSLGGELPQARSVAAKALRGLPSVMRTYTHDELVLGTSEPDAVDTAIRKGFHEGNSGDVEFVLRPLWVTSATGTTHGSPHWYDTHVPLMLMGPGIEKGTYHDDVNSEDIAPFIALTLGVPWSEGTGWPLCHAATRWRGRCFRGER